MPFKSEAQRRLFHAKADRGEISQKTVHEWEHKTKNKEDLPYHAKHKKSAAELAMEALQKSATYAPIRDAVLATDGKSSSVLHDIFNGGKWAPGGVEYQGPMKIAAELPTNVADRAPSAIGSIIGAPKPKMPKLPKPPKPPKVKKTAAEIADFVIKKAAAQVV